MSKIDKTALVKSGAEIDTNVEIGPFSFIGNNVKIKKGTKVSSNVHIEGNVIIGENNKVFPFVVIGMPPQDIEYKNELNRVVIGNNNIIREYTSIHMGTTKDRRETSIGDDNFFMAYSHIAHDCEIGNNVIMTNGATLGGHSLVEDFVNLSAFVGVHQFTRIGKHSFVGGYSVITKDIPPFVSVVGSRPAVVVDTNSVGMRRNGVSKESIKVIREAFKILYRKNLNTKNALKEIKKISSESEEINHLVNFIEKSKRGIIKKHIRDVR